MTLFAMPTLQQQKYSTLNLLVLTGINPSIPFEQIIITFFLGSAAILGGAYLADKYILQPLGRYLNATNVETKPNITKDPLEQFDVVSIDDFSLLTNLSVMLFFCLFIMGSLLWFYNYKTFTNFDFIVKSIYKLVKNILKENLYIKKQQYFSILFYLFLVILLNNMVGLIPYSFTVTSSFVVTFFLALMHFIGINLIGISQKRWEFQGLFLPGGSPLPITPFLVFIELVSYIARVFSLSIRLFANMMSGHALLKILIGFSWTLLTSKSLFIVIAIFPWIIVTIIMFLELLIAFLQAYVFVILVTIYINDVLNLH